MIEDAYAFRLLQRIYPSLFVALTLATFAADRGGRTLFRCRWMAVLQLIKRE
jgi:hypothetical protein